jgi:outer membrane protein insertion porin family
VLFLLVAAACTVTSAGQSAPGYRRILFHANGYEPLAQPNLINVLTAEQDGQGLGPAAAPPAQQREILIEDIRVLGNRRIPRDTVLARIFTKRGDVYDLQALQRDFMALWNAGFFEDLRMEEEPGEKGGRIIVFYVREKPQIRTIEYGKGLKSLQQSEILDRFKERKVGLTVESPYDPTRIRRAEVVIQEYLAERGRPYATVEAEAKRVPPNSIKLTFQVDEGPKVKVGKIDFTGNPTLSDRTLRSAMRFTKPIGIPKSIVLENLFARTFDQTKLGYDLELVRTKYQDHGYFKAVVVDPTLDYYDVKGKGFFGTTLGFIPRLLVPWRKPKPSTPGKRVNLTIPIQEGEQFRLGKITFSGVKFFRKPEAFMTPMFAMAEGDIFQVTKIRKGLENLKELYGQFGFINMVATPETDIDDAQRLINMTFNIEEDKQFLVRRIEFTGNTTTRDKVIRREMLIDEGDMFNTQLWNVSILRMNQLGFFEPIKDEQKNESVKPDNRAGQVDINLRVKEKGKNTIGLTGGVSGIAGSFLGFNYSTNNFLGLGETLTFDVQMGTRERDILFGFTEPYLFDRPLSAGFTLFMRRFNYNQAREASILTGQNLIGYFDAIGRDAIQDYRHTSRGFTVFTSYPLRRSFARVGLTYGWDSSSLTTFSAASKQYFEFINFRNVSGPNALQGITTSKIIPTYSYNTVNHPLNPTQGRSIFAGLEFTGVGGNVRMIRPTISYTQYYPVQKRRNVIGFRILASMVTGYGGRVAPPFERFYIGGEQDVRGFDIRVVSPIGYIADEADIPVLDNNGNQRLQDRWINGVLTRIPVTTRIPLNRIVFPGGDLQSISNFEYRVPIAGPVTLAAFFDAGMNTVLRHKQLTISDQRLAELTSQYSNVDYEKRIRLAPGTNRQWRTSTGLEIQVVLPIVQAPFRLYYAYNLNRLRTTLDPGVIVDRSQFPNELTYIQALAMSQPIRFEEPKKTFRFTISRTF